MAIATLCRHALAGRLEGTRLGVRLGSSPGGQPGAASHFVASDLLGGPALVGPVRVDWERDEHVEATTFRSLRVSNPTGDPLTLRSVVLGFLWRDHGLSSFRFLKHGWQSWSACTVEDVDSAGDRRFPSGSWLRGLHHALGEPDPERSGWHESHTVSVASSSLGGPSLLAGVLEQGSSFGLVYLRATRDGLRVEVELQAERVLDPGQGFALDPVRVALDNDPGRMLERFATLWGRVAGARTQAPFQAGWCSWYHFFHHVSEEDLNRNLDALSARKGEIPVDVVQLDDGYQRAIGDWTECNDKFPSGLEAIAGRIRSHGFRAGLWTAPFCVVPESRLFAAHPEWLLRDPGHDRFFRGLLHGDWSTSGSVHVLDPSQGEVLRHVESLFAELNALGFDYLKLDFLYVVAMQARAQDPHFTPAERLRLALEAVRRGAGEAAFLLGCGCPMGPAVGIVDGMRISADVAPYWQARGIGGASGGEIPGIEATTPSVANALPNIARRVWMHRRLWLNDPDCLMARSSDTDLLPEEVRTLASAIAVSGGMTILSDDVAALSSEDCDRVRRVQELAREVDSGSVHASARVDELLADGTLLRLSARSGCDQIPALMNLGEEDAKLRLSAAELRNGGSANLRPLLGGADLRLGSQGQLETTLAPHASATVRLEGARSLAVFCDFDGTFSVQDVGSTLAQMHLADRRPALWARYEAGTTTAWEYNMALLEGFEFPEEDLLAFLRTIELDPGASDLVAWCAEREVPFRVLSDGFDHNLDRLQEINGVRFAYDANHLRYERGRWRIAPGAPSDACTCGTGTCKRGRIGAYRAENPGAFCVHVGNGRVSDLCGALEADLAFAKDTLAPALDARGAEYIPFETLYDVIAGLERETGMAP